MHTLLEIGLSNAVVASALALVAGVVGSCCRRPAVAHGLWLLVLLKLLTPPLLSVPVSWPADPEPSAPAKAPALAPKMRAWKLPADVLPEEPNGAGEDVVILTGPELFDAPDEAAPLEGPTVADAPPSSPFPLPWRTLFVGLWVGGSAVWLVLALARIVRFQRLLRHARPAPPRLQARAERLAERLGLARCPQVALLPGRLSPMLWVAGGAPRLLLPAGLLEHLSAEQQATLLAHELAHLRRRDHWVRALELLTTALYWWHPVVWWARHELREAEEQCCDAWVVWALPEAGRAYATALVDTLDFLSAARAAAPALASGIGHVNDLKRRLTMIMRGTTPRSLTWAGCLGLAAVALVLLPVVPSWAQTDEIQKKVDRKLQIERLKKELEELSRADDPSPDKLTLADKLKLEMAGAEIKGLAADVEKLRVQLREAEARLKEAQDRLSGARTGGATEEKKITLMIREADGKTRTIELPPGADVLRRVEDVLRHVESKTGAAVKKRIEIEAVPGTAFPRLQPGSPATPPVPPAPGATPRPAFVPLPPGGPGDARLRDLEKKIEALMKELESLRRDMKAPKGGPTSREEKDVFNFYMGLFSKAVPAPSPGAAVPPPEKVDGAVKAIDPASGMVSISIGSDSGIQKGHTLQVYRLEPSPMYLGTLQIVDTRPDEAVARPVSRLRSPLQPGDRIAQSVAYSY